MPPLTVTVAFPFVSPLQETFVELNTVAVGPAKLFIVTETL